MKKHLSATVIKTTDLAAVPSGSALELAGDRLYIISDDAPYFFEYSVKSDLLRDSVLIAHLPDAERRIPKPIKPDYEAAVSARILGKNCIVAFGSGSLRPQRDSALIISTEDPGFQKVVSLTALYAAMRTEAGIADADFNIEAAALHENRLMLINRGSNHVFSLDWAQTLKHLLEDSMVPSMSATALSLPKTGDFPTGISGACFLDADRVIFTASAEATTNWTADGEVLGSFIGVLKMDGNGDPQLAGITPVVKDDGSPVKDKIEGVCALGRPEDSALTVLCIVDNDDGSSRLLHVRIDKLP